MANIFESAFMTLKNGMTMYFADSKARQLIDKLKALVDTKYGPDNPPPSTEGGRIWYAVCSTAAGTGAKTATSSTGDFVLQTGAMVRLKCTTANTAANPTISIDGSTAKTIQPKSGTSGMAYRWRAQEVIDLVYDGSNFVMSLGPEADTSFYGITKLNSSTSSTSTTEAATPSAVKAVYDATKVYGEQTNITSGTHDLNDYKTAGLYYFSTGATLSNQPNSAVNGWLTVYADGSGNVKQVWQRHGSNPTTFRDFYMRLYTAGAWGSWARILEDSYLPLSVANGGTGSASSATAQYVRKGTAADDIWITHNVGNNQPIHIGYQDNANSTTYTLVVSKSYIGLWNTQTAAWDWRTPLWQADLANIGWPIAQGGTGATTAANARTNLGALANTGDTSTGWLAVKDTGLDSGSTPSSDVWGKGFDLIDKNGKEIGQIRAVQRTNGTTELRLRAIKNVNGSNVTNEIVLAINSAGTRGVNLSDANAWMSALGASKFDKLWTNSSPTANFDAQTVAVGGSYNAVLVVFKSSKSASDYSSAIVVKGLSTYLNCFWNYRFARLASLSSSGVTFGAGNAAAMTANLTQDNQYVIPVYIYGIKGFDAP